MCTSNEICECGHCRNFLKSADESRTWGEGRCCHEPYPYGAPEFPSPHFDLEFRATLPWTLKEADVAIIFDLDGTLWDSTGCVYKIWNRVLEKYSDISLRVTKEKAEQMMGKTMEEIGESLFPELDAKVRTAIVDKFGAEEVTYLTEHGAVLYEGLEAVLKTLSQKYKLYIVSNSQDGYVQAFLQAHKLEGYFADIEMSGRTGLDKGNNIKLLMERNHITSAVYVGDTQGDEVAAHFAGIPFIYAKYGFGEAKSPDAVIKDICELPECIKMF